MAGNATSVDDDKISWKTWPDSLEDNCKYKKEGVYIWGVYELKIINFSIPYIWIYDEELVEKTCKDNCKYKSTSNMACLVAQGGSMKVPIWLSSIAEL